MSEAHAFTLVIPVADRPRHLRDCLASLAELLRHHPYAGEIEVLIAEDSLDGESMAKHRDLAVEQAPPGAHVHYLGLEEQRDLVAAITPSIRDQLRSVIGTLDEPFGHKGASITRNIAYLWLHRWRMDGRKRLFWFFDSDQEFRVNSATESGETLAYEVDYLNELDRIFNDTTTRVLTGKVVGDPPVSPAVMAGTFLDDVFAFVETLSRTHSEAHCAFHAGHVTQLDAAYHDMADLFGFQHPSGAHPYRCPIVGAHDHGACLADFADRLERFFDGEHPTRRTYHDPVEPARALKPARTLYTGNYVITPDALEWFIPFAALRLRMAGPTLGRLLRARLGADFVSANLPMLHRRTVEATGQAEYRAGLRREHARVDLSGEFERQYYGDVMLFTMEKLCADGYPDQDTGSDLVDLIAATEKGMRQRYRDQASANTRRIDLIERALYDPEAWWRQAKHAESMARFDDFIANMRANFTLDAPVWRRIQSPEHNATRLAEIASATRAYRADRRVWRDLLNLTRS